MLLMHVELNGLYTEGLYRKSGSACRARELHQILEMGKIFFTQQLIWDVSETWCAPSHTIFLGQSSTLHDVPSFIIGILVAE